MGAPIELRFADFEVSPRSGELRRNGLKIKLQEQPFQILVLLLEQRGETVTREELRQKLWTADTFVDFDNGLNIAIKKLRTALGDDAGAPRYIETLPRRGYRFIAPVTAYEFRLQGSSDVFDAVLPDKSAALEGMDPGAQRKHASNLRSVLTLVKEGSVSAPHVETPQLPIVESRRDRGKLIGAAAAIAILAVAATFGVYKVLAKPNLTPDTRNMTIRPLTEDGRCVGLAGISPDGSLLAYVRREDERFLRVKQVAGGSEVTVVPPQAGFFGSGLTFTLDGNHLYYSHLDPAMGTTLNLYSVPALGGTPRQIVSDVASGVTFSPDGKRMAYLRAIRQQGEDQLIVANADGSRERVIARREHQVEEMSNDPSWSAANNLIAVGALETGNTFSIGVITPEGKLIKNFALPVVVGDVAWAPGFSGIFFIGWGKSTGALSQVWFQPYPAGQPFKISNDLNAYTDLSVAADGRSFVTAQTHSAATVYVGDSPATLNGKVDWKLTAISNQHATGYDISWTPAGKLLQRDLTGHVYETASDGSGRADLLESDDIAFAATACGPGEVVVLARILENNQPSLWLVNVITGELKRLTFGRAEEMPSCTPDGKWVVYQGYLSTDSVGHLFKVPIDGGTPVELALGDVYSPSVSPDGKFVIYGRSYRKGAGVRRTWAVQSLWDGSPIREIEVPAIGSWGPWPKLGWTPDGHAFTYVGNTRGHLQNVYIQALRGGAPVQLTHFDSEPGKVAGYGWSKDGKKFAITRERYDDTDVVIFSNF